MGARQMWQGCAMSTRRVVPASVLGVLDSGQPLPSFDPFFESNKLCQIRRLRNWDPNPTISNTMYFYPHSNFIHVTMLFPVFSHCIRPCSSAMLVMCLFLRRSTWMPSNLKSFWATNMLVLSNNLIYPIVSQPSSCFNVLTSVRQLYD